MKTIAILALAAGIASAQAANKMSPEQAREENAYAVGVQAYLWDWLPAPAGNFNLTMRFYGPETSVLDGSYRLHAIHRVQ